MRSVFILCCCIVLVSPVVGYASLTNEIIEQLPAGSINWTRNVLVAKGTATSQLSSDHDQQRPPVAQWAYQLAMQNILQLLSQVRVDSYRKVSDVIAGKQGASIKIQEMAKSATVLEQTSEDDGKVTVTLQMPLLGGFAQLMLPPEIKQVETIKPVSRRKAHESGNVTSAADDQHPALKRDVYTGLIVDARGIGARPAMVPTIRDENGEEVYSAAYISREFAVQQGVSKYVEALDDPGRDPRTGPKPLLVKGLRTIEHAACDIVISNADASKLRSASAHLKFLKQCRVIIILQ